MQQHATQHKRTIQNKATIKATGPLTQATGPPRSDAGVGIGMLKGISLLSAN